MASKKITIITDELPFCEDVPDIKFENGSVIKGSAGKEKVRGFDD